MSPPKATRGSESSTTRLRASCDGCYLAKIKCNKARPMCSRCLTYGIDCVYSPSSRSGRVKRDSDSDNSRDCYETNPSFRVSEEKCGGAHHTPRPPFQHIAPASFLNNESSYENGTIPTRELGQSFGKHSIGDGNVIGAERDLPVESSAMEPFGSSFRAQSAETTKFSYTFPQDALLPLSSEMPSSPLNMSWAQFADGQLDFTSHNTPTLHFMPCFSLTPSIGDFSPEDCICLSASPQDQQVPRDHFCPNFRQHL